MERIENRRLFKFISATLVLNEELVAKSAFESTIQSQLIGIYDKLRFNNGYELTADDLIVLIKTFDYGDGSKNPLEKVRFFEKHNPKDSFTIKGEQVSIQLK